MVLLKNQCKIGILSMIEFLDIDKIEFYFIFSFLITFLHYVSNTKQFTFKTYYKSNKSKGD